MDIQGVLILLRALIFGAIIVRPGTVVTCEAGTYLDTDPNGHEKCVTCEPGTFMTSSTHRLSSCSFCKSDPQPGSRMEVKRPCSFKADTEIGCDSYSYRVYNIGEYDCYSCTICETGEEETAACTEFHNRECSRKQSPAKPTQVSPGEYNCSCPTCPKTENNQNQTSTSDKDYHANSDLEFYRTGFFILLAIVIFLVLVLVGLAIFFAFWCLGKRDRTTSMNLQEQRPLNPPKGDAAVSVNNNGTESTS